GYADPRAPHACPTRRSSDLGAIHAKRRGLPLLASFHTDPKVLRRLSLGWVERPLEVLDREVHNLAHVNLATSPQMVELARGLGIDRKSTRLNSSHVKISYAV